MHFSDFITIYLLCTVKNTSFRTGNIIQPKLHFTIKLMLKEKKYVAANKKLKALKALNKKNQQSNRRDLRNHLTHNHVKK